MIEEEVKENTEVLDGEFKIEEEKDVIQENEVLEVRVKEYKKVNKPFSERTDIDFDTFYYGNILPSGLVEVRKRTARDATQRKWNDRVIWYEGNLMIDGVGSKIAYHVIHEPSNNELFPEYFYPTTQWNISRPLLSD